jgi:HAMP domain-containing protein
MEIIDICPRASGSSRSPSVISGFDRNELGFSMNKSLRLQSVLMLLLYFFLFFLLVWAEAVPLEQIRQYAAENTDKIGDRVGFQENLVQVETLIWSAIAITAVIGFLIPWMISRRVLNPILSIQNTIREFTFGDPDARIQVHAVAELEALANELNGMMELQKQEHERLLSLNRMLSAISACRHVMIHESNENQLTHKICRFLVNIGAYRIAWIGYTEDDAIGTVTPAALSGYQNISLNTLPESRAEKTGSPAARAIRNKHSAIINDIFGEPLFTPLQAEATLHGYASVIALPLSVNQRILGALTLYAEKSAAFGTEEVRLMTELADDLAHGINAIRNAGK